MRKKPAQRTEGFHIATFTPKTEGVHTVLAREEQVLQHGDGPKFRQHSKRAQRIPRHFDSRVEAVSQYAQPHRCHAEQAKHLAFSGCYKSRFFG